MLRLWCGKGPVPGGNGRGPRQLVPGEKVMGYDFLHEYRESQQRIVLRKADFSTGELSAIAVVRHEEPDVPYQRDDSFPDF